MWRRVVVDSLYDNDFVYRRLRCATGAMRFHDHATRSSVVADLLTRLESATEQLARCDSGIGVRCVLRCRMCCPMRMARAGAVFDVLRGATGTMIYRRLRRCNACALCWASAGLLVQPLWPALITELMRASSSTDRLY